MNEPLPVMVWIHGGKFESGAGGTDLYHGSVLAAEGQVVVVTINYRLGALGFLATAKLDGNMGFQAQRLALQWVQKNIAGFGGNPGRVTIFGENAGGTSVAAHVASPASKGLFHAAIVQSDPWPARLNTRARGQDTAYRFAKALACDVNDVACMRSKSVDEVYHAQNVANGQFFPLHIFDGFMHWTPTVGTPELPEQPMQTIMHNRHNNVPMMLGSVQEEAVEFIMGGKAINKVSYAGILLGLYHTRAKDVMELYPLPKDSDDCRMIFASVITDHLFACAHRRAARAVVDTAGHAHLYRYNQTLSFDGWGKMQYCNGHACHGVELPYLFNTVEEDAGAADARREEAGAADRPVLEQLCALGQPERRAQQCGTAMARVFGGRGAGAGAAGAGCAADAAPGQETVRLLGHDVLRRGGGAAAVRAGVAAGAEHAGGVIRV